MRTNGLDAPSYVAIAELDPRVADAMLERLRAEQIAAYAQPPQAPATGPLLDAAPPVAPAERLYVDDQAAEQARAVLEEHLAGAEEPTAPDGDEPEGHEQTIDEQTIDERATDERGINERGIDDTWRELVASFHQSADTPVGRWPVQEDLPEDVPPRAAKAGADDPDAGDPDAGDPNAGDADDSEAGKPDAGDPDAGKPGAGGGDTLVAPADGSPDDSSDQSGTASSVRTTPGPKPAGDDEHFVPPPPPPLPRLDAITKAAWLGLIGGPVVLILALVTDWYFPYWLRIGAAAAFAVGFLVLVFRSRGGTVDDSDGTGAIV